ncbi:hypothetical protein [Micromonospora zhanjiangensis]
MAWKASQGTPLECDMPWLDGGRVFGYSVPSSRAACWRAFSATVRADRVASVLAVVRSA